MTLAPGTKLRPYEILSLAGTGGMGEIYRARDTRLDRTVAIRVLSARLGDRPAVLKRFEREIRAISGLSHPHICTIYSFGEQEGVYFLVMEYLEGETLSHRLQRGRLSMEQILEYGIEIAFALEAVHRHAIIHRNLKPDNIMLTKSGVKLMDLGLAALEDQRATVKEETAEGIVIGAPPYMSPEQAQGEELDARTDLFSFGVMLYEMATGRLPFSGPTSMAFLYSILHDEPLPLPDFAPEIPPELGRIIQRALKDRDRRYQSASEMILELRQVKRRMEASLGLAGGDFHATTIEPSSMPPQAKPVPAPPAASPSPPPPAAMKKVVEKARPKESHIVRIFYATDRSRSGKDEPAQFYTGNRGVDEHPFLGTCDVSVPEERRLGSLEGPKWWRLEFQPDPQKHIVLVRVSLQREDEFFAELTAATARSEKKEAFIFIHGYNVSFEDAARRTAQLAHDLTFKGAPILYSWPSKGRWWRYFADETSVDWSVPHFRKFLEAVAVRSQAQVIHLIAHSMGNRLLANGLKELALARRDSDALPPRFQQVVLAAPDIDTGVFLQLAEAMRTPAARVTLYASSHDWALRISKLFHWYPRAGYSGKDIFVVPGVDTVDISAIKADVLGHSYFGDNRVALTDVHELLSSGTPPEKRFGLRERWFRRLRYWVFAP